jgi:fido (protein-threonine AMPylation protein)
MSDAILIERKTEDLQSATACAVSYLNMTGRKSLFLPKSFFLMVHKELLAHDLKQAGCYRTEIKKLDIPEKTFDPVRACFIESNVVELIDFINNKRKWWGKFEKNILKKLGFALEKEQQYFLYKIFIAWFVHHKFTVIHPFADWNGRTARLLMCLMLRQEGLDYVSYPAQINNIINEDKSKYLDALNAADNGDYASGVFYMMEVLAASYKATQESESALSKESIE